MTISVADSAAHEPARTRVLIAVDGSPASLDASAFVRETFPDAEVVVVTVVDGRTVCDEGEARRILDVARLQLGRAAQRVVRTGSVVTEICDLVDAQHVDVVAIGVPSAQPRLRAPVGERLLRRLDCEVLVVPRQPVAEPELG